jgi:hypothetical protein
MPARIKKNGTDRFCGKHRHRFTKHNNIVAYTFNALKSNAKRRGKEFTLTRTQFKKFCLKTDYIKLKGRRPNSASIDRIDSSKGYSLDNIQILSLSINSSKGNRDDLEDYVPF